MSHQTRHALWSRQMTSHNLADRMSPSWKRDMFLLNLQRGHEAAMVFAIAQEYGCSLDASNGKSNEHQESRIAGPGYDVMLLLRLSADLIQFGNCHPLHRHSEGVWAAEFYWTFSHDEGALSQSQNQNMEGVFEGSCGFSTPIMDAITFSGISTRLSGFGNSSGCSHNAFKRLCVLVKWRGCYHSTPL